MNVFGRPGNDDADDWLVWWRPDRESPWQIVAAAATRREAKQEARRIRRGDVRLMEKGIDPARLDQKKV